MTRILTRPRRARRVRLPTLALAVACTVAATTAAHAETYEPEPIDEGSGGDSPAAERPGGDSPAAEPMVYAPVPFDAAALEAAIDVGERWQSRLTSFDDTWYVFTEVVAIDARGPTFAWWTTELDGTERDARVEARSTWAELETHASWPDAQTTITEGEITVPAGTFAGVRYLVVRSEESRVDAFFATDIPGAPVRFEQTASGQIVLLSELVEHIEP